ncbi:hypothetical protein STEG23_019312, partial [Scotinomys teguina]
EVGVQKGMKHNVVLKVTCNRTCATAVGKVAVSTHRCIPRMSQTRTQGNHSH